MGLGIAAVAALMLLAQGARAGFVEDFSQPQLALDPQAHTGWAVLTGAGEATASLHQRGGVGVFVIDARRDRRNIWWAVIKRAVTPDIDRTVLGRPDKALRIETRIRLLKPRRVNLSLNHTRTTDFHRDLMEYDIADTAWHTISFTDRNFDARPEDEVFAQLALYDAGRERHFIEIDYFRVDVVDAATAAPDLGNPLPYRPPLPPLASYANALPAAEDAVVDSAYPWVNFAAWTDVSAGDGTPLDSVSGSQMLLLRWDFATFAGRKPKGWGTLALTTERVHFAPNSMEESGYLRVVEIHGGDPAWRRATVTRDSFLSGNPERAVLNPQLITDTPPAAKPGERTLIEISPAVLKRLLSGKTKGLAVYSQGAINAVFASGQARDPGDRPTLYFDTE